MKKKKKGQCVRSQPCKNLQALQISTDKVFRIFEHFVLKTSVFLWFPEHEWKTLGAGGQADALEQDNQSQMLLFFHHSLFHYFKIMETILNQLNSCQKTCDQSSKSYDPHGSTSSR